MILYFQYEKARLERKRIVEMSKGYGKPKVGGPFNLRDLDGKEFTEKDLLGKYSLVGALWTRVPLQPLSWAFWKARVLIQMANARGRSISDSRTVPISARTNSTRCLRQST